MVVLRGRSLNLYELEVQQTKMVNIIEKVREKLAERKERADDERAQAVAAQEFEDANPGQIAVIQREQEKVQRMQMMKDEREFRREEKERAEEDTELAVAQAAQAREARLLAEEKSALKREQFKSERRFGGLFPSQEESELKASSQERKAKLQASIAASRAKIARSRQASNNNNFVNFLTSSTRARAGTKGRVKPAPPVSLFSGGSSNDVLLSQPVRTPKNVAAPNFFSGGTSKNIVKDVAPSFFGTNGKRAGNVSVESLLATQSRGRGSKRGRGGMPSLF